MSEGKRKKEFESDNFEQDTSYNKDMNDARARRSDRNQYSLAEKGDRFDEKPKESNDENIKFSKNQSGKPIPKEDRFKQDTNASNESQQLHTAQKRANKDL